MPGHGPELCEGDRHGLASLDIVGEDNITFETDYPHTDSSWPDTLPIAEASHLRPQHGAG